jgi:hypothetical protein
MAPTKTDTGHGALFDSFPDRPSSLHGGAKFDEGFNLQAKDSPKGPNFDEWGAVKPTDSSHGPVWDEWGWKDMPESHGGVLFDEGFDSPAANTSSRGPLFDLFEPSTQVKFIYGGQDSEGIVDQVRADGVVMVTPRGGNGAVEVGLEQFLAYKSPSTDNATTIAERSQADAPSADDKTAIGGNVLLDAQRTVPDTGTPIDHVAPGPGNPDARADIPVDWSITDHLKTLLNGDDVAKNWGQGAEMHQVHPGYVQHTLAAKVIGHSRDIGGGVLGYHQSGHALNHIGTFPSHADAHTAIMAHHAKEGTIRQALTPAPAAKTGPCLPSDVLKNYSAWGGSVAKEVTVAETAIQAESGASTLAGAEGAGSCWCPECRKTQKLSDDGRCPDCNMALAAHGDHRSRREKGDGNGASEDSGKALSIVDDLRKAFGAAGDPGAGGQTVTSDGDPGSRGQQKGQAKGDPPDVPVEERAHPESDHNESPEGSMPGTCPHCGQVIAELDAKTDEGAPANAEPGGVAHKCLEMLVAGNVAKTDPWESLQTLVAA